MNYYFDTLEELSCETCSGGHTYSLDKLPNSITDFLSAKINLISILRNQYSKLCLL